MESFWSSMQIELLNRKETLEDPDRPGQCDLRLHRDFLQPPAPPFRTGLSDCDRAWATVPEPIPNSLRLILHGVTNPWGRSSCQLNLQQSQLFNMGDPEQGIVHVVGPQLGLTQPGMTIVCGDSHTSTHGAFGALAFGIGTSEAEHVLAMQTLPSSSFKTMAVKIKNELPAGSTAKDVVLALIAQIGTGGGQGYVLEYRGRTVEKMSMEARMTLCNMSIQAGARAGLIAPDTTTLDYLRGRPKSPDGAVWDEAAEYWLSLGTDEDAIFDAEVDLDASLITPFVTWGTNPSQGVSISGSIPVPCEFDDARERAAAERALAHMDQGRHPDAGRRRKLCLPRFSCTNGRIEDLRAAAAVLEVRRVKTGMRMLVVPGSMKVKTQAEDEGLDKVFIQAGAEWRFAGCSMCLGMNPGQVGPGERCVSTSNRNFE